MSKVNTIDEYNELRKLFPENISDDDIQNFVYLCRAICKSVIQKRRKALYSANWIKYN